MNTALSSSIVFQCHKNNFAIIRKIINIVSFRGSSLCVMKPQDLIDKCLIINVKDCTDSVYISIFPNCKHLT